jgi:hypothetical protein
LASLRIYKKNQYRRKKSAERPGKPDDSGELGFVRPNRPIVHCLYV